jgi:hypothetical protein
MTCDDVRTMIDEGKTPPSEHLGGCEACAVHYDRVCRVERTLEKADLSARQLAAIEARLFPRPQAKILRPRFWAPLAAATAAAAAMLLLLVAPRQDDFLARGAGDGSIEVICLDATGAPAQPCTITGTLQLRYTTNAEHYLFVFGKTEQNELLWYTPTPAAPQSTKVAAAPNGGTLPFSTRLAVNHTPGRVRIYALFTDEPIALADVEKNPDRYTAKTTPIEIVIAP